MKKISSFLLTLGIIVGTLNVAALAADEFFTDEGAFASWYASSARKMSFNNIITGYPDGSFQGINPVSRAELAVILDRYTENVVGKQLQDEGTICTAEFVTGLQVYLRDQNANPITGATITTDRIDEEFYEGTDGMYSGLGEQKGQFDVTIEKEGYGTHYETVVLEKNDCHVKTQTKTITLFAKSS